MCQAMVLMQAVWVSLSSGHFIIPFPVSHLLTTLLSVEVAKYQKKKSHSCHLSDELCYDPHLAQKQLISPLSNYFWLWINESVIPTRFTVYGCKCSQIKAGHRCTFSNQVDRCPNTAADYPEQAHSLYFTVFTVLYNHGIILCRSASIWPIR